MSLVPPICVSLGSNIEPHQNLPRAIRCLKARLDIVAVSKVYLAKPVGAPDTPTFLNAAIAVSTEVGPQELKDTFLRPIEVRLRRKRSSDPNAPRTIDLDLSVYRDLILGDPGDPVILPDPDILCRAHVALPLADIAPTGRHPLTGETFGEIARRFELGSEIRVYGDLDLADLLK